MQKKFEILCKKALEEGVDIDSIRFCGYLFAAHSQIEKSCVDELANFELLEGRFVCMLLINNVKKISPHELAKEIGLTRASITAIADHLEEKGYIERKPSLDDRRSIILEMTDKGKKILEDVTISQLNWLSTKLDTLTKEEKVQAINILSKLSEN